MNHSLCREFIQYLDQDGNLRAGNAPKPIAAWLAGLGLPHGLSCFMQWDWPQQDGYLAHIAIFSSSSLHQHPATARLAEHQFLNAGSAPNGDWFVIDFSTEACAPGFITHEEWNPWADAPADPRPFFQPIARNFEAFLYRVAERRYLPTDYYAAREFNQFLKEEPNS
jgi:hypothetical protein